LYFGANFVDAKFACGVYLKKFELILCAIGSAGGITPDPPFRPPRLEAEAKRQFQVFLWRKILLFSFAHIF
jgi:hypothetical protein